MALQSEFYLCTCLNNMYLNKEVSIWRLSHKIKLKPQTSKASKRL